jgi:hypothetical protein
MSPMQTLRRVGVVIAIVSPCLFDCASAQQSGAAKSGAAEVNPVTAAAAPSDAALKESILASSAWKQASDGFQKWLASQAIYTPAEIAQIQASLTAQIQSMPASELQGFLDDWQAKLKVLNGRDSQDAQQWLGQYLSVLADGIRRRSLSEMGLADLPNMTASQLEDAFIRVRARRLSLQQSRAAFDQNRQQRVQMVQQNNAVMQQARLQRGAAQFGTNQGPYRPSRFDPPPLQRGPQFFVDGDGRIGFVLP